MLKNIFEPKSITIVGASNDIRKWGGSITHNLINAGFTGKIYPVNYREKIIQGLTSYYSVLDIPEIPDLAIIVVPANIVSHILNDCGLKGIKGIIIISAGFKEIGNKELEDEIISIVKQYDMRMIGPNTLGIINTQNNLNASIISKMPKKGGISFIAQSGTMGIALVEDAVHRGIGLNKIISIGNKADIDDIDLLEYLDKDDTTNVIVIYAESINRGKDFIKVCKNIKKPIIILKAGRSSHGTKAAFSHTGSMAGSDEIYSIAFKQAGIIRVDTMEEIFDAAIVFSQNLPEGCRVGIITNGGGAGIIATDLCEKYGIDIADIEQETKDKIKEYSKEFSTVDNPLDTAANNSYDIYCNSTSIIIEDKNVDALIVIYVHTEISDVEQPAWGIVDAVMGHRMMDGDKPVIACFFGSVGYERGVEILNEYNIPNYTTPERAVRALNYLLTQKIFLERKNNDNTKRN